MRTRIIAASLTAALFTLTACSSDSEEAKTGDKPKASAPSQADLDKAREAAGLPPKPDAAKAFVDALNAIDPDIVHGKDDKAISRASNTCSAFKHHPGDRTKQIELTNKRWISANHPDGHGLATAEKILDLAHKHICPDF